MKMPIMDFQLMTNAAVEAKAAAKEQGDFIGQLTAMLSTRNR